jgi:hypothetical protein
MSDGEISVSVVVLTYNSARFVARCLNSLCRQTRRDFEVLVVDAGSTDGTREIVARYDGRFRWLELPGSDMGMARNFGAAAGRGRYLCFLDADDLYLPEKLARQVAALDASPKVGAHFCRAYHFRTGAAGRVGVPAGDPAPPPDVRRFLAGHNENLNTLCLRRSVWQAGHRFGEGDRGRYGEEWRHQLAMALGGVPMQHDAMPLVVVELRPDSHTAWERQWMMKQQAIGEVERAAAAWGPAERRRLGVDEAIDAFRAKLAFAFVLAGRLPEARNAAGAVRARHRSAVLGIAITALGLLPAKAAQTAVRRLWLWRQDRLFRWQRTPPAVAAALNTEPCS